MPPIQYRVDQCLQSSSPINTTNSDRLHNVSDSLKHFFEISFRWLKQVGDPVEKFSRLALVLEMGAQSNSHCTSARIDDDRRFTLTRIFLSIFVFPIHDVCSQRTKSNHGRGQDGIRGT